MRLSQILQLEERLAVFDECLAGDAGHKKLLEKLVKLTKVAWDRDAELAAVASRLSVFRLLQIAYNSGVQRKQRRTTAIKRRGFTARAVRLLTKDRRRQRPPLVPRTKNSASRYRGRRR